MIAYPTKVSNMKPGVDPGRLIFLSEETITELTPRDIIPYIAEGFAIATKKFNEQSGLVETSFVSYVDNLARAEDPAFDIKFGSELYFSTELDRKFILED